MADYTVSSDHPTILFDCTGPSSKDFELKVEDGEMHFRVGNPGWPSALNITDSGLHFKHSLTVDTTTYDSQILLQGDSDWRLHAATGLLDFDVYYSSTWQTVFALVYQAGAADQLLLHSDLVLARSGTLIIDQLCSTETHIAEFQKRNGTTLSVSVEKDGTLDCTDDIGVRTVYTTTAPSGGTPGDVVIYTDTSTYTSYLRVKTSAGWCGIELDETP